MKDILVLLVLLNTLTTKVCSQPYQADSYGNCLNHTTEYLLDDSDLCCKKCLPGYHLTQQCNETTETVCEKCPTGLYMESRNYAKNCFSCTKCKKAKGLQEAQSCSSTKRSRCVCQPGMFCVIEFEDPYCTACSKYKPCRAGYGVSLPGTKNSDVRCERCPTGTFSNRTSPTDPCQPHKNCHGMVVARKGDATSDTECGPEDIRSSTQLQTSTKEPRTEMVFTTERTTMSTVMSSVMSSVMSTVLTTTDFKAPPGPTDSTLSVSPFVSEAVFNYSTKTPPPSTVSDSILAAVIAGVIGFILFFIAVILLFLYKSVWKKGFHPKVDANGNCEIGDKQINQDYLGETQLTSFKVTSPEQQCLLQNGEVCSDHSQCSNNTETLTQTDGCSSQESIGPLLSTLALHNPHSALSEPMTLLSNAEPVTPQPSVPAQSSTQSSSQSSPQSSSQFSSQSSSQSSSQPTSPPGISPVNVNIIFNINGSCGKPSVTPTDLMQADSKLPFGEEEESFSIPQQEAGKQSLMSVQESES